MPFSVVVRRPFCNSLLQTPNTKSNELIRISKAFNCEIINCIRNVGLLFSVFLVLREVENCCIRFKRDTIEYDKKMNELLKGFTPTDARVSLV